MSGMTPQAERLAAARDRFAVGPVLERGILRLTGKNRLDYLHRMGTQDVNRLAPGEAVYGAFLNHKGHLVGEGAILAREQEVLLDLEPGARAETLTHLSRYVLRDDVKIEDLSAMLAVVPGMGPEGMKRAASLAGRAPVRENPRRGAPALDVYLPRAEAEAFREALLAQGAVALEAADLEALRILGGFARFGADMDGSRMPMEAGLTRSAISFTKGCYVGQEVVVRATMRGQLQKGLVQLAVPDTVAAGESLRAGGQQVGEITSVADTPEGRVALGYVRRAHWKEGERLEVTGGEAMVRRVVVEEGGGARGGQGA